MGASVHYRLGFVAGWQGVARAGIQHAGRHPNATWAPYLAGDPVDNINGRLSFSKGPWTVSLYGENLANDRGATGFRTVGALNAANTETYAPRLRPRTLGMELVYSME